MAAFTAIAAGIGAAVSLGTSIDSMSKASAARRQARDINLQIQNLENNRQPITNPYENISDLSGMINNPFANLQVATKAAEMQARETDISLASTLDALRATGAGAGGATALAQAAARSKQGISASIEQQEAKNAQLRAQGEAQANQMRIAEAQRLQQAQVAGEQFVFSATEQREMQKLNRLAGLSAQQQQMGVDYMSGAMAGLGSTVGALANLDSNRVKKNSTTTNTTNA